MGGHFISWRMSLVLFIYIQKVERETTLERLKQLGRQIKRLIVRQSGSQAGRWTDRKADRQTDRQTRVKLEDRMWKETQRQTDRWPNLPQPVVYARSTRGCPTVMHTHPLLGPWSVR